MKNKLKYIFLGIFSVILIIWVLPPVINVIRFSPLPPSAINGAWAATIVAEGQTDFNSIDELATRSRYVIRGEIISESEKVMRVRPPIPGEYSGPRMLYSVYSLNVLYVYKGDVNVGDIINFIQVKGVQRTSYLLREREIDPEHHSHHRIRRFTYFVRNSFSVGDDLILFLNTPPSNAAHYHSVRGRVDITTFNPIQGAYRYTPQELRTGDNWVFESVNEHNNLTLTEADLQRLREANIE